MANRRHIVDLLRVEALGCACLSSVQSGVARNDYFLKLAGVSLKRARQILGLTKPEVYIVEHLRLITNVGNLNLIRSAHTHSLNRVTSVDISNGTIDSS